MKTGYAATVLFPPDLDPTPETRHAAFETFERQTGHVPIRLFTDEALGLWGWMSADAVMLFRIPAGTKGGPS